MNLAGKIPKLEQISPVYAVIVVMIYPWSLLRFFWRLPSWLNFSSVEEIAVIYTYTAIVNLIESVIVLFAIVAMCIILPKKWLYDRFVARGSLLVSLGLGYLMYFNKQLNPDLPFPYDLAIWTPGILLLILILVHLVDRIGVITRVVETLADRLIIFLYISIPISVISLFIVLIRNIS